MAEVERGGRRQMARETEAASEETEKRQRRSLALFSRGVTKKARRKPGRVDRGSESAFRLLSRVVETRRARPKPRRASARARTVDRCHLIHRARHAGRVHDARAHLLACRSASKTFGGFLRQRGGNVRDSRMGFGVRFFVFRRRAKKGDVRASRVRSAHLPRRLCRRCRTRLRPGTGPIR